MSTDKTKIVVNASPGFFFLFVVFFVLKVTETVAWSWWWVTAPLWLPWVVFLFITLTVGISVLIVALIASIWSNK